MRPEFCKKTLPSKQRARGRPGARCTRGLAGNVHQKMRPRADRFSGEHTGLPHATALRLIRDRPGDRLSCHHHPQEALAPHELDASTGTSGPHDFAVRSRRARQSQPSRPPLPAPTSATMAYAPLAGQDGGSRKSDLPDENSGIFLRQGLDRLLVICPSC